MHTHFHIPSCNVNHYPQCRLLRKFRVIIYCYLWSTVKPWIMKSIRFDGSVSNSMGTFENKMGAFFPCTLLNTVSAAVALKELVCCQEGILWEVRHSTSSSAWAREYLLCVLYVSFEMKRILFLASNTLFKRNIRWKQTYCESPELPLKWIFSFFSPFLAYKWRGFELFRWNSKIWISSSQFLRVNQGV